MRSLQDASASWQDLKQYTTLNELREAVRFDGGHTCPAASAGLRSACWKAFLLFENVDTAEWPKTLAASRSAYNSLRMHFLRHLDIEDELSDPLSDDATDPSPQSILEHDLALRAEIHQDVDRCMPDNHYFRQLSTQHTLTTILFIWAKLNPDTAYRQGMHEVLAPILWVVERDAVDLGGGSGSKVFGEDATVVKAVFGGESVEEDAFAVFSRVMRGAKDFYELGTQRAGENRIVVRSRRIFEEMLPQVDPELAEHLRKVGVVPQVFLMRWIRLLFGREFAFDDVLTMWDIIFAEDPTLEIVDHICLAMILRIRWELLDADYNSALTLLLRYPVPGKDHPPQTFVLDALYLRDHLDSDGSGYLVLKYTNRPLLPQNGPTTPPALQRNITAFSGVPNISPSLSSRASSARRQPTNLETVLQSTARTLYTRGGKAVRGAVEEVHKRAQEIRDTNLQTPSLPPRTSASGGVAALYARISALERRNRRLGDLLEGAVGALWEVQGCVVEDVEEKGSVDVEKLSGAIARVQFVQVYLGDGSLPLPEVDGGEEGRGRAGAGSEAENRAAARGRESTESTRYDSEANHEPPTDDAGKPLARKTAEAELADPATFEVDSDQPTPNNELSVPEINAHAPTAADTAPSPPKQPAIANTEMPSTATMEHFVTPPPKTHRPALSESPYSWMLGQQDEQSPRNALTSTVSPDRDRSEGGLGLFGDGDTDGHEDGEDVITVVAKRGKRSGGRDRRQKAVAVGERVAGGEDIFRVRGGG